MKDNLLDFARGFFAKDETVLRMWLRSKQSPDETFYHHLKKRYYGEVQSVG